MEIEILSEIFGSATAFRNLQRSMPRPLSVQIKDALKDGRSHGRQKPAHEALRAFIKRGEVIVRYRRFKPPVVIVQPASTKSKRRAFSF